MRKKVYRYTKDDFVFVYHMLVFRSQGMSYPNIGKLFNKDHSTVIHWCKRYNVNIGSEVPPLSGLPKFDPRPVYQRPYKYMEIIEEPINRGKLRYSEYVTHKKTTNRPHPKSSFEESHDLDRQF